MSDTITHKAALKEVVSSLRQPAKLTMGSKKKVNSSYREHYSSSIDSVFQTRAENIENFLSTPRLKIAYSARELLPRKPSL
jgi:hypothetical protein